MLVFGDFDLWPDVHLQNCQNYRTYVSVSTGEPILEVKNVLDMFHSLDYFYVILLGPFITLFSEIRIFRPRYNRFYYLVSNDFKEFNN